MSQFIFLVEDDDSMRQSMEALLRFSGYTVYSFATPQEFLQADVQVAPAIVISDMRMPGMSGVDLHKAMIERGRMIPFVYISAQSTLEQGIAAMKQGAVDFLIKPFDREDLLAAVVRAMEKDQRQMHQFIQQARHAQALGRLSKREKEVYGLLLQGFSNQQILSALGISLYTAKQYKSEVMRKLGVRSLAELLKFKADLEDVSHRPGQIEDGLKGSVDRF
jgi:FixJ family two-component response regulator